MKRLSSVLAALMLSSCGPVEIRIDETKGVPSITGETQVAIGSSFTCGQPITGNGYTVSTRVISGGCEFTFDDDVTVLSAESYKDIPSFDAPTNLVDRIELKIKKVDLVDGSGAKLDLDTRVTSAVVTVDGTQIADKSVLKALPKTVSVTGALLQKMKAKIDARQALVVDVKSIVVLPDSPAYPESLRISYDLQPAVILGTSNLF